MRKFVIGLSLVIVLWNALLLTSPVYAINKPSSVSITDIHVNRNLLETGDMLVHAKYEVAYDSTPSETINDTFIFNVMDTDNTTVLGSVLPYPFDSNGFGEGIISFYFGASSAPTWGQAYCIRVAENPAYFASPDKYDSVMSSGDYTTLSTQADNREELRNKLITLAQELEIAWDTTLTTQSDVGTVLNTTGAAYFRYAIVGLQSMCPEIFSVVVDDPEYDPRSWNVTQATTYENRFDGTWVGNAFSGFASMFGNIDQQLSTSMIILIACGILIGGSMLALGSPFPGLLMSAAVLPAGMMLGMFSYGMMAIIAISCALYIGYFWFFARS